MMEEENFDFNASTVLQELELEDETEKIKFDEVEDIIVNDKLFEMCKVIDIKKLLSTKQKRHSKIPNPLEQDNIDEQTVFLLPHNGRSELELIEHPDGFAELKRLDEIYYVCIYFNIERQAAAEIIRQHLKLKPIYAQDVRLLCYYKDLISIMKSITRLYITKQFEKYYLFSNNQVDFRNKISDIILEYNHIFPEMFHVQFVPLDFQDLEDKVMNGKLNLLTREQLLEFQIWKTYLKCPIVTINKTLTQKYHSPQQQNYTSCQVQQLIDSSINNLKFNKTKIDISKGQEIEEQYFIIATRQLDYKETNKVYLEVRSDNKNNGKPMLVTKSNNSYFIANMFTLYLNSLYNLTDENNKQEFHEIIKIVNEQQDCCLLYFDIDNFLMNVDYKLVESIGFEKLAKYLTERKIYYQDPQTTKEVEIKANKGIYFGEVFASEICCIICNHISSHLTLDLNLKLQEYTSKVYFTQGSIVILTQSKQQNVQMTNSDQIRETLLKQSQKLLQNFSFEINQQSIRYYSCLNKQINAQKQDSNSQFVNAEDFILLGLDLLQQRSKTIEFTSQQINHMQVLVKQFEVTKTEFLRQNENQDIINFINFRLIKRYLKYSDDNLINKKQLQDLLQDIDKCISYPSYKNKVPFY